jgi:hypothetical protein
MALRIANAGISARGEEPIKELYLQLYLIKFNGQVWMPIGPVTGD